jgi:hypothetical protein
MDENTDGISNDPVIIGEIIVRRKVFLSKRIPVTIRAKNNGLKITIFQQGHRSRYIPYQDLRSVVIRNIFGWKRILLHAEAGVESINCHSSDNKINAFCDFVNEKIALPKKKPLAARFALTKTEVPLEKNYTAWVYDEFGSAIDVLFNQEDPIDDLLAKLEIEITSSAARKESVTSSQSLAPPAIRYEPPADDYPLFRKKHSYPWNIDFGEIRLKRILPPSIAAIASLLAVAWVIDKASRSSITPGEDLSFSESAPSDDTPPVDHAANHHSKDRPPRAILHLITLMKDSDQYSSLIDRLRHKRELLNIDSATMSSEMGWDTNKLANIETQLIRADPMDIINISIHLGEDFLHMIEFQK